jgi:hypothetical protein
MPNKHQVLTTDTSFPHPFLPTYVGSSTALCAPYWFHYPPPRLIFRQMCKRYSLLAAKPLYEWGTNQSQSNLWKQEYEYDYVAE